MPSLRLSVEFGNDLAPVKGVDEGGGQQHYPFPGCILRCGKAEMYADSAEGQILTFFGHECAHLTYSKISIYSTIAAIIWQ